jgi:hypothetical protein
MKLPRLVLNSLCLLSISQVCSALPQYINEFHYDNSGADRYEYVEIAGVAGSSLDGWRLDFYNGTNGRIYSSWTLSGLIDDEGSGYGALSFSGSGGLQNGPKDGIALVDELGSLVQFISYEGSLLATEGAASGMISQDIGITEGGSVALGQSLQLSGSGFNSEDFTWTSGISSFGELNSGQQYINQSTMVKPMPKIQSIDEPRHLGLFSLMLLGLVVKSSNFRRKLRSSYC